MVTRRRPVRAAVIIPGALILLLVVFGTVQSILSGVPQILYASPPDSRWSSAVTAASAGCGRPWSGRGDVTAQLVWDGLPRTYLLHVPPRYSPTTPVPLVLNLHGAFMNAQAEAILSRMSVLSDRTGFLLVYPNGTKGLDGKTQGWSTFTPRDPAWSSDNWRKVDDVGFLDALVRRLESQLCVDTTRIDVTGMSSGAVMAYHLACSNMPWLAAIAPVAGLIPQSRCLMAHPTSLIAFNGTKDPIVHYNGQLLVWSVPTTVANYAAGVGCQKKGRTGFTRGDVVQTVYTPCRRHAEVQLYTVTDGGHTWPGGFPLDWSGLGKTTRVIDASALMVDFFMAHPRAPRR